MLFYLSNDNLEFLLFFCNTKDEAVFVIDHIIELNGGKDEFFNFQKEGFSHCFQGYLFSVGYQNELYGNHVLVEILRNEKREFVSLSNSEILYGIHKDSKKVNSMIQGLNSIIYNTGEMTSGGGQFFYTASDSHIVSL